MKPEDKELADRLTKRADACEGSSDIPYMGTPEPDGRPGYDAEIDLRAVEAIKRLSNKVDHLSLEARLLGELVHQSSETLIEVLGGRPDSIKVGASILRGCIAEAVALLRRIPLDGTGHRIRLGEVYDELVIGPVDDRKARIVVAVAGMERNDPRAREIFPERFVKFIPEATPETTVKKPEARSPSERSELLRYLRARRGG